MSPILKGSFWGGELVMKETETWITQVHLENGLEKQMVMSVLVM